MNLTKTIKDDNYDRIHYVRAMFSDETCNLRNKLRATIAAQFPSLTTDTIYDQLRHSGTDLLTFDNLAYVVALSNIDIKELPDLLQPYGIRPPLISKKQFRTFYEDEYVCCHPEHPIPKGLNKKQISNLKSLVNAIRKRTTPKLSDMWKFAMKYNPQGSSPSVLRVSSLCRMVSELDLNFAPDVFLAAFLQYMGKKVEAIDFNDFAMFIQTFS